MGCAQAVCNKIIHAIGPKWLAGIKSKIIGFTHRSPKEMLAHLRTNGAIQDNIDVKDLIGKMDMPWNPNKNPATKFERDDMYEQQLTKFGIPANPH